MIKVIKHGETSVNFVDDNENFVGYSLEDDCCAHGGWFIADKEYDAEPEGLAQFQQITEFPNHVFDEKFFREIANDGSGFNCVIFKMVENWRSESKVMPLYLHLFNVHNGYYAKGFKCTFGEKREGSI